MRFRLFYTPLFILITGAVLAVFLYDYVKESQALQAENRFNKQAASYVKTIEAGLGNSRELLVSLKSFIANSDAITRDQFDQYAKDLLKERKYIQALEWIPKVGHGMRKEFENYASEQGLKDYFIKYKRDGKMLQSPFQPEYFPVYYVYPLAGNETAIGYNLSSNSARLKALVLARDTNSTVMSQGIKLVQEKKQQSAVLMFLPVYRSNATPEAVSERRRHLQGFALLVLRIPDLIEDVSKDFPARFNLQITDMSDGQILYSNVSDTVQKGINNLQSQLGFSHRHWKINLSDLHDSSEGLNWIALLAAIGTLCIASLASLYLYSLSNTNHKIKIEVEKQTKALKISEQRFSLAVQGSSVGIWDWQIVEENEYWSPQYFKLIGYENNEITPNKNTFLDMVYPEHKERLARAFKQHIIERKPYQVEFMLQVKSGEYQWFFATGQASWNSKGEAQRMVGSIQKIDERKKAEIAIIKYAEELQRSNKDLEQFAYVASHDLKAPLRGISNLATWIEESVEEHLDDENRSYMNLLQGRISRLESLLDGLLQYSRAGTEKLQIEMVDVGALVIDISDLLGASEKGFKVESMPFNVKTDKTVINQVLHNLINNSIKHHHLAEGSINITHRETDKEHLISVCDDGPGIDPKMYDKVFQMFQTLRPRDEVEGSGMGLAIVKKLIERNKGRIWIESHEEVPGCSICFSMPKA